MRAGLLREIVIFKELVQEKSPTGAVKKVYSPILTCKAWRKNLSSVVDREGVNAMEQFIGHIIVFQVRYHPAIKESQRVEYQGREYEIKLLDRQRDNTYIITIEKLNV